MTPAKRSLSGIYAITDPVLSPPELLVAHVAQALTGGIALLQYRNKLADRALKLNQVSALLPLCRQHGVPLLINDDVLLCQEAGADGVHLGQLDGQCLNARQALGDNAIIGITCHDRLDSALQAEQEGASYAAFGRFFPSLTKPDAPPASLATLIQAKQQVQIPVVAIGGINTENGGSLIAAGADMLAVINGLFAATDITARARALNALFHS